MSENPIAGAIDRALRKHEFIEPALDGMSPWKCRCGVVFKSGWVAVLDHHDHLRNAILAEIEAEFGQLRVEARQAFGECQCPDKSDNWFDRTICPEPCGSMHTICSNCGYPQGRCPWQEHEAGARLVSEWRAAETAPGATNTTPGSPSATPTLNGPQNGEKGNSRD